MSSRRSLLVLVGVLTLVLSVTPFANASHSWGDYHWARTTPGFTLLHGDNVDSTWQAFFDEATGTDGYWTTDLGGGEQIVLAATAGSTRPRQCRAPAGRVEVCNDSYGNTGWLGIAGISVQGGHITSGYVKVNDTYFDTPSYDSDVWRRLVMCQEIGHTLGLGHQDENHNNAPLGTCMDYHGTPSSSNGDDLPNAHDFEQLQEIYGHVDGSNSYDTGSTGGGDGGKPGKGKKNRADTGAWGRQIASNGNASTYARTQGDTTWITHVIWAE